MICTTGQREAVAVAQTSIIAKISYSVRFCSVRVWSTLYALLRLACPEPAELSKNNKIFFKNLTVCKVSMHIVLSGERRWCIKERCVGVGGLKLSF